MALATFGCAQARARSAPRRRLPTRRLLPPIFLGIALIALLMGCDARSTLTPCPAGQIRSANRLCTVPPGQKAPRPSDTGDTQPPAPTTTRCPSQPARAHLTEFLPDPEGSDGFKEWIELHIDAPGVLDGMFLRIRNSYLGAPTLLVPLVGSVKVGDYVTVDDFDPRSLPMGCSSHNGCIKNSGGVLELLDCEGEVVDAADWGDASSSGLTVRTGWSLALCDVTGDWLVSKGSFAGTNGEWRDPTACPVPCARPPWLRINEVLYDLVGADGEGEFIELWGPPHTPMTGIRLRGVNGGDGKPLFTPMVLDGATDEEGMYLIAGRDHSNRNATLPSALQNGPEALILEDCDGLRLDAITYGGDSALLSEYNTASPVLPAGRALGRYPDAHENVGDMRDFREMTPTPGAANRTD